MAVSSAPVGEGLGLTAGEERWIFGDGAESSDGSFCLENELGKTKVAMIMALAASARSNNIPKKPDLNFCFILLSLQVLISYTNPMSFWSPSTLLRVNSAIESSLS